MVFVFTSPDGFAGISAPPLFEYIFIIIYTQLEINTKMPEKPVISRLSSTSSPAQMSK